MSGIEDISPKAGSKFAGQTVTITGFGFAPVASWSEEVVPSEEDLEYLALFSGWINEVDALDVPFGLDITFATFDTIIASTHFRDARIGFDVTDGWIQRLTINTAQVSALSPLSSCHHGTAFVRSFQLNA